MLFTRTIRRTMVCGLAMLLFMTVGLLVSAIYSQLSDHKHFRELTNAFNDWPRKAELADALIDLKDVLHSRINFRDQEAVRRHRARWREKLKDAKNRTDEFLRKLTRVPYPELERSVPTGQANSVYDELCQLDHEFELFADFTRTASMVPVNESRSDRVLKINTQIEKISTQIEMLQRVVKELPDFQGRILTTLNDAEAGFQQMFRLVCWSGAIAVLLTLGLILYGYRWVYAPLQRLHQGALRVAQGDFNYRLTFIRQDEMKELADAFNCMTARFQEIARDLDRQVCERSKQLVRSERLAGIGFLAAGVAHEINNPLSAIAMAAESLNDRLADPCEANAREDAEITQQYLQMIQREAFRCQRITQKLLDFARGNGDTRARHDLTAILNDVLGVVRHMGRYSDRIIRFNRTAPCWLEINGPEIQQVIMNLVSNGLEAMDSGGTMTIDITEQTDEITLFMSDDGCGMTPEVIENLFEPFYTQRRNGRGTGLGLSISHRIVTDHGGTIEVASPGLGRGSTFRVRLPRRAPRLEAA